LEKGSFRCGGIFFHRHVAITTRPGSTNNQAFFHWLRYRFITPMKGGFYLSSKQDMRDALICNTIQLVAEGGFEKATT
jgi:hypothetical protein